eukprot:5315900-Prymnesium_polylepis.1
MHASWRLGKGVGWCMEAPGPRSVVVRSALLHSENFGVTAIKFITRGRDCPPRPPQPPSCSARAPALSVRAVAPYRARLPCAPNECPGTSPPLRRANRCSATACAAKGSGPCCGLADRGDRR